MVLFESDNNLQKFGQILWAKYTWIFVLRVVSYCNSLLFSGAANIPNIKILTNRTKHIYQGFGSELLPGIFSLFSCQPNMEKNGILVGILCATTTQFATFSMWCIHHYIFIIFYLLQYIGHPGMVYVNISSDFKRHRTYWIHCFGKSYIM